MQPSCCCDSYSLLLLPCPPLQRSVKDLALQLPQSSALAEEDDDGEESELVDFWTKDYTIPKGIVKKLGYKVVQAEGGEFELVAREEEAAEKVGGNC